MAKFVLVALVDGPVGCGMEFMAKLGFEGRVACSKTNTERRIRYIVRRVTGERIAIKLYIRDRKKGNVNDKRKNEPE